MTYTLAFLHDGNYQVRLMDNGLPLHLGTYAEMDALLHIGYPVHAKERLARVVLWTPHVPLACPEFTPIHV